jgi:aspartyl-tRNA(Asn)/glutamyl-tRNA(Gln) amidotransferase subunit A
MPTPTLTQLQALTATAMVEHFRAGALSPVEVATAALDAIDTLNPKLNAVIYLNRENALDDARASQERWRRSKPVGPMDGVPTVIKDGLLMRGFPIHRGSIALEGHAQVPDMDAPPVARLRESGAVFLAKTTMCDFGMMSSGYSSKFGPTRNPWDLSRTSGGSSSGTSALLAAGIVPVAVGTDIVGSIRVPASFCGLTGLKPSFGRVPFFPQSSPAAVAGPMARNVRDMALLMSVITQPDARDFSSLAYSATTYESNLHRDFRGTRVAFLPAIGFGPVPDPEVVGLARQALPALASLGCEIQEIISPFQPGDEAVCEDFYRLRPLHELEALPAANRAAAAVINHWADPARQCSGLDHYRQFLGTQQLRARTLAMMDTFDFLALPVAPQAAYAAELPGIEGHSIFAPFANTFLFNLTEQPAISVPCGCTQQGLPVGLQLVAQRFNDLGTIQLAHAFEGTQPAITWPRMS